MVAISKELDVARSNIKKAADAAMALYESQDEPLHHSAVVKFLWLLEKVKLAHPREWSQNFHRLLAKAKQDKQAFYEAMLNFPVSPRAAAWA